MLPRSVELRDDRIYWEPEGGKEIGPSRGMLEAFYGLADAPNQRILAFAKEHGVLKICEHGLPCSHNPEPFPPVRNGFDTKCYPLGWLDREDDGWLWEPLTAWRTFSRQAFALSRVADRVFQNKLGRAMDWQVVYEYSGRKAPWWQQHVRVERMIIARVLNEWHAMGGVRPEVVWHPSDSKPSIRFGGPSLFGALALQLTLVVGQSAGLAICTHCRTEYSPTARRPKSGQRNFCQVCRAKGIPSRYSLADHRERLKDTKNTKKTQSSP